MLIPAAAALIVALVVAAVFQRPQTTTDVPDGVAHVHGLGINPADQDLYAATHVGLFRIPTSGQAVRVGRSLQDTMGFTVTGPDRFLASGHPDLDDDHLRAPGQPPLLGLIESTNGGRSWKSRSLLGQADFHTLVAAHGRVYGYDSTGRRFMVSSDGKQWDSRSELPLSALAVDPADADHLVATTGGGLTSSRDGGRSWQPLEGPPLSLLSWGSQLGLWGTGPNGETYQHTRDRWEPRSPLQGPPEALLVNGTEIYAAASADPLSTISVSTDGGSSWRVRYSDTDA